MRPFGPEPWRPERSMPPCSARRRASGEASTRSPPPCGAGLGVGVAAVLFPDGLPPSPLPLPPPTGGGGDCSAFNVSSFFAGFAASPSPASVAIGVLTFTPWLPSGTRISAITPSSTASTSIVALSVSISAMTWPGSILSPALTCHLARLPSSIVGESAGMVIWVVITRRLSSIGAGR